MRLACASTSRHGGMQLRKKTVTTQPRVPFPPPPPLLPLPPFDSSCCLGCRRFGGPDEFGDDDMGEDNMWNEDEVAEDLGEQQNGGCNACMPGGPAHGQPASAL